MKRITFLLSTLFCSLVTFADTSGTCGNSLNWTLDNNGTLTISGSGPMYDYSSYGKNNEAPWRTYKESITFVRISEGVTSIGQYAFQSCKGLISVAIPNSVKSIRGYAFAGCSGLTSVTIPTGVACIEKFTFWGCSGLKSIEVEIGNTIYDSRNNCNAIIETATNTLIAGCQNTKIPQNVKRIGEGAFAYCKNLTSITIPYGVTSIEFQAFYQCTGLTSITIPSSVTSIGKMAFYSCEHLEKLKYPKGLNLSEADIPATTKVIAYGEGQKPNPQQAPSAAPVSEPKQLPSVTSAPQPTQSTQPPLLALVDESLTFKDGNGNNRIDAEENCTVKFRVANNGKGAATNCEARVKLSGATNGITINTVKLPTIAAGSNYEVSVPVTSSINTIDGLVSFAIEVYEPQGWGVAPFTMNVATKAYNPPFLQVVDYNIASNSGKIRKMEPFTITFNLQNTKYGDAENVKVKVNLPANVFVMDGSAELSYPTIKSGEVKHVQITLAANNNYSTTDIPITIDVKEKHGKFAENKQLNIALNQTTSSSIQIVAIDEPVVERKEIQLAMIKSDVDRNIPTTKNKNNNTFVLIVANEHYLQEASVPFAMNDGNIFKEYCIKTLGIGEKHIKYLADATGNQIKAGVNWLANLTEAFDNPQIIVYYAGHGIPDEASKSAYLLPVDGSGTDVTTGYKLDELYAMLGNMPASKITVFMDACFSGSKREEGMLASARGVALKAKSGVPQGKMVVFSAAQGDETAYPYREQQHGMFTYHLLKKLQETSGDVTLQELGNYIIREVKKRSLEENDKKQTPCVTPSAEVGTEWQNWKLK